MSRPQGADRGGAQRPWWRIAARPWPALAIGVVAVVLGVLDWVEFFTAPDLWRGLVAIVFTVLGSYYTAAGATHLRHERAGRR